MKRTVALIAAPPVVGAVAVIVTLLTIDLPSRLAVHWGVDGVDQVGGVGDLVQPVAILVPVLTAVFVAVYVWMSRGRSSTVLERSLVVISSVAGLGVALTMLAVALVQPKGTDAAATPIGAVAPWIVLAFVLAAAIGVGAALLTRPVSVELPAAGDEPAPALDLGPGERASWSRVVTAPTPVLALIAGIFVVLVVGMVVTRLPWVAVGALVLGALVLSNLAWRVTVDASGIRARSFFGIPRFSVAASDVLEARVLPVRPLRDFGGWGVRVGGGSWGVIMRAGEALEVVRDARSSFVVTVDDAETAATLLNALARRRRG